MSITKFPARARSESEQFADVVESIVLMQWRRCNYILIKLKVEELKEELKVEELKNRKIEK
ncbi:MAG: hypothetical protein K0S01_760 [Herbinix sp.]|jgi:hypothetical protein|nr:hypothetical protein [Herbinix sp.]